MKLAVPGMRFPKISKWIWITLAVFLAGGGLALYWTMPVHAGWRYGACKVFLQRYVRFPPTVEIRMGGETRTSAVIGFSDTNPYGSEQVRMFECHFSETPKGVVLSKITIDRKALPEDIVSQYNAMLPLLSAIELDTELPKDLPSRLEDLKD